MNNYSVLFSIKIGGPFQNYLILSKAIDSIFQNIFTENFQILISYETNNVQIVNYIKGLKNSKIIKNKVDNFTWYNWMIKSSQYAKNFDYLYLMHDDIYFLTKNFDQLLHNKINKIDSIGIINLTDLLYEDGYYKSQTRHGFYIDRIYHNASDKGQFAEFKKQKPFWHRKNLRLKNILFKLGIHEKKISKTISRNFFFNKEKMLLPKETIKTHGGCNDLMIFKRESLNIFSKICDFELPFGLNSDEDTCLVSLKLGFKNILISDIFYKSNYEFNFVTTRSFNMHLSNQVKCDKIFYEKWQFPIYSSKYSIEENVTFIKKAEKLHGKNVVWTKDFNSFDYQYL